MHVNSEVMVELLEVMQRQRLCAALHLCGRVAEKSRCDAGKGASFILGISFYFHLDLCFGARTH